MESLGEDEIAHVMSFLDLKSLVLVATQLNRKWRTRLCCLANHHDQVSSGSLNQIWKDMFHRLAFSKQDSFFCQDSREQPAPNKRFPHSQQVIKEIRHRKQLQQNLWGSHKQHGPFHLSNRRFNFVPIFPDDTVLGDETAASWQYWWDLPPSVSYPCDSFELTSTALGTELLFLNPFTETLTLNKSILDGVIHSQDLQAVHCGIADGDQQALLGSSPDCVATTVPFQTEDSTQHKQHQRTVSRNHCFIAKDDNILDGPLISYFSSQQHVDDDIEVELYCAGVDAKPLMDAHGCPLGITMYAVAHYMSKEMPMEDQRNLRLGNRNAARDCSQLLGWVPRKSIEQSGSPEYEKVVCRFRGLLNCMDFCPTRRLVYVNVRAPSAMTRHNFHLFLEEDQEENIGNGLVSESRYTSIIHVYPFLSYEPAINEVVPSASSFGEPTAVLDCQDDVLSLALCPTGNYLIVATSTLNLQIWQTHPACNRAAMLLQQISCTATLQDVLRGRPAVMPQPQCKPARSIICPRGVPIDTSGFCTLHQSEQNGSSILFWHKTACGEWSLQCLVNLPLLSSPCPEVHYDGNRLVVFGRDHIGLIVLLYRVYSTQEHLAARTNDDFTTSARSSSHRERSGGVINLYSMEQARMQVEFVNRIRHQALDCSRSTPSLYMSCNERFLAVSTQTGNLLYDEDIPFSDGILVIDMDDHY